MKVLIACEFSGIVRDAFRARGHDAWSCDLLPTESTPMYHHQRDVFDVLQMVAWDMLIFHAPCTRLCNSGVRWLSERDLWQEMKQAGKFFRELLNCGVPLIAGENPIPHKYAVEEIGCKYDQLIQPYQFGHGETKATCLWLRGLPKLTPTDIVPGRQPRVHYESPGVDRDKRRSRTLPGIAAAMANQWGSLAESEVA
jgi:hypothetical protein